MNDMKRIIDMVHMQPGKIPPGPADQIKAAPLNARQPIDGAEVSIQIFARFGRFGYNLGVQTQGSQRQGRLRAGLAILQFHQFHTAPAQIAHHAIGIRRTRQHAKTAKPGFFFPGKHTNFLAADLAGAPYKFGTIGRIPRRRCGQHIDPLNAHFLGNAHKTRQGTKGLLYPLIT